MDVQNYKNVYPKVLIFCYILKMRENSLINPQTFFVIVLFCTNREDA